MEQRPSRKQSRNSKNSLTFNSGGTHDSYAMNMPQSMMVLSEADELRRRRNTEFARNYDELVDAVDLSSRHHSSLAPTTRYLPVVYRSHDQMGRVIDTTRYDSNNSGDSSERPDIHKPKREVVTMPGDSKENSHLFVMSNDTNTVLDRQRDIRTQYELQ